MVTNAESKPSQEFCPGPPPHPADFVLTACDGAIIDQFGYERFIRAFDERMGWILSEEEVVRDRLSKLPWLSKHRLSGRDTVGRAVSPIDVISSCLP
ncbi:unnamed protein product [Nezara viridula]|uniref:Uncharacterized protein n=1 Tax=Nezara viridula TaxID=85310 RepID=A0A9P0HRR9_NEZVI|nr:unnamed protein product [Nezara viridula]